MSSSIPNAATTTPTITEKPTNPSSVATEIQTDATADNIAHSAQTLANGSSASSGTRTKSSAEEAADRLYEERIEEEYAKREGGA